ncbi:MAG: RNA polymerase sigma factor [Chiayiivirga sp.]|jgi:RNA polymerase sigma-70 factor (ECF subfamily)|uniref:RNA polymerase sigma factor n=1 Tax=Chiayiivirga sp. TaxID=2041042 RepID=UPI0025BE28F5|nr:RNA polymerase sigma factor [Chiayiivirga sp.]MCI1728766.1 RNA polymerase sigma factor [Chiayiivirga sp.]MCI1730825.1 RNA polymerase sigma factor [Chiayiivirga sp.]
MASRGILGGMTESQSPETEARWVNAARRGDPVAFRRLVETHARPLHRVCQRLLGDAAAAEDALQDAFINAWRGLERFDGRSAFGSWLRRIAVNAALGQLRQRRIEVPLESESEEGDASFFTDRQEDPFEHASGHEFGQRLGIVLQGLSRAERCAFVLRHFEQYPLEDIAGELGCNVNACKQTVFRAVRKLRAALSPVRSEP